MCATYIGVKHLCEPDRHLGALRGLHVAPINKWLWRLAGSKPPFDIQASLNQIGYDGYDLS